jgi:hypothetical protein
MMIKKKTLLNSIMLVIMIAQPFMPNSCSSVSASADEEDKHQSGVLAIAEARRNAQFGGEQM